MIPDNTIYPPDILQQAWFIAAKHLSRGEKDVTKMIADAIVQERKRWTGPDETESLAEKGEALR